MTRTRVISLNIDSFRRFSKITIPFGERVTLIAGQNGTAKSTLLGMLAQPFSFGVVRGTTAGKVNDSTYTDNFHGLQLDQFRDLTGKPFMYDCDDVFRLSRAFDFGKQYSYRTALLLPEGAGKNLADNSLFTVSRDRKTGMRFVTGPRASHEKGEGNYPHPVIYLGLNRLWPLAEIKKCTFPGDQLSADKSGWFVEKYNEVLCLEERDNGAKFMDAREKRKFITPESADYDGESCSAGQDNLSQILTAILSFRRLKKQLCGRYQGGMLLIDELDATLHAYSQAKLLELLCEASHELDLQIIATSHSLFLLEKAFHSSRNRRIEVLYLINRDGRIEFERFSSYQDLSDHLKVETTPPSKKRPPKVSVVFEDSQGQSIFQQVCGTRLNNYITRANTSSIGDGQLKNLADMSKQMPMLNDAIFLPDGDTEEIWKDKPYNLLALPGGARPETLIYRHLFSMKDSDPFWKSVSNTYTRQVAITAAGGNSLEKGNNKRWVKSWYKKQSAHWDRGNAKVFKSWIRNHRVDCLDFCKKFLKLLKGKYQGEIPKDLIERILALYSAEKR